MFQPFHSSDVFIGGVREQTGSQPRPTGAPRRLTPKGRLGYLFKHTDGDRLDPKEDTVPNLMELGHSMREESIVNSKIPSAYTYFGQFIAHDITFDPITKNRSVNPPPKEPLTFDEVNSIENRRTGLLDLDSVYSAGSTDVSNFPVPRDPDNNNELRVGVAYTPILADRVRGTDLPRDRDEPFPALIGDRRNDENLPLSQLHLSFLRAHNLLVRSGLSFNEAKSLLKRRYQFLVVKDFLPRLVHPDDLAKAGAKKELYSPSKKDLFIPIEFTAAAFRFGHSMIRSEYAFNQHRGTVSLTGLFTPDAIGDYHQILADWVIDWSNFVETGTNKARAFYPQLVEPLEKLIDKTLNLKFSLAVNDLLRGYLLGLPTGQALAKALGITPLTKPEVLATAISSKQREILEASGFAEKTPLWFYIFAEARKEYDGTFLGPVCGQLVALVLEELARLSDYEDDDPWNETLGKKADFNLSQFLMNTLP